MPTCRPRGPRYPCPCCARISPSTNTRSTRPGHWAPIAFCSLAHLAAGLGLDVLLEVHDRQELETALSLQPRLIGINNRNLKTFETSLTTTFDLLDAIPAGVTVVTESGIRERSHVQAMLQRGVRAFLVGEAFMRAADPGTALRELFG